MKNLIISGILAILAAIFCASAAPTAAINIAEWGTVPAHGRPIEYVVREGDTYSSIYTRAVAAGIMARTNDPREGWWQLQNFATNPPYLMAGQRIWVPRTQENPIILTEFKFVWNNE